MIIDDKWSDTRLLIVQQFVAIDTASCTILVPLFVFKCDTNSLYIEQQNVGLLKKKVIFFTTTTIVCFIFFCTFKNSLVHLVHFYIFIEKFVFIVEYISVPKTFEEQKTL